MQQQNTIIALESHMDELNARCVNLSKQITGVMTDTLLLHGVDFSQLNDNEAVITELEEKVYPLINTTLQTSDCSGAFFILDATCNTQASGARSRMGMCLRYSDLSGVNSPGKPVVYFRGGSSDCQKRRDSDT